MDIIINWIPVIQELIKWISIPVCIITPVCLIIKCIKYLFNERNRCISESEINKSLYTILEKKKELERKKDWEQFLLEHKTIPAESSSESPEMKALQEKNTYLSDENERLTNDLEKEKRLEKAVMLFQKLAVEKDNVNPQSLEKAIKEIDSSYEIIKKNILNQ